ncbi:MAG: metabolite traffic protein EboE [Myxococcota bacterium]
MITYCSNIHPGETWGDVLANLESHALAVKQAFSPDASFPLGLRLSARAAGEVDAGEAARFRDWCGEHGFHVPSLNGFPHGQFHGPGVKEKVYLPDWRSPERVAYTLRLAEVLADWLPGEGGRGSISSVPIAWKAHWDEADRPIVRRHLEQVLAGLERIRQQRGCAIVLALEPEPRCLLETTEETIAFFEGLDLAGPGADLLGVCFDCCHQAVEFEDPAASLAALAEAGVPIAKVQVSSSLRATRAEFAALAAFDEPTYLHQVVARSHDGGLARFDDLPAFLALERGDLDGFEECRVHFHVPIFSERVESCGTTRFFLEEALPRIAPDVLLEVETYSWNVLPPALRTSSVTESIVRELRWAREACATGAGR